MDRKILLVEQDPALLESMKELLGRIGYEVDGVSEPEAAQSLLAHVPYALVITDVACSDVGFNGLEVLASVWDTARRPKIIAFSYNDNPTLGVMVRRWGADVYLNKPASLRVIVDSAVTLLKGSLCRTRY
jgi:DNA-binding response OmpR family regulator